MILVIHRDYRLAGGEEVFLESVLIPALGLRNHSFEVLRLPALFARGYRVESLFEIVAMVFGFEKLRPSYRRIRKFIDATRPTHIVLNNFIPTVSLAVPALARSRHIEVLAWVHNGRLSCANGLFFNGEKTCHRCFENGSRWAFFYKCHKTWLQSLVYALTYRNRRVAKVVTASLDRCVATSNYTAENIRRVQAVLEQKVPITVAWSAPVKVSERGQVFAQPARMRELLKDVKSNFYVFIGRISFEKGADLFADLAARWPDRSFVLCGEGPELGSIRHRRLTNLFILGHVGEDEKNWLYQNANALILTSRVPENAPMVIVESHFAALPVVYPRGGGAEELVQVLGRPGCALDEFKAQQFDRDAESANKVGANKLSLTDLQINFENQLDEIVGKSERGV